MKKLGSNHDKETSQEVLKRLRKENKKLASQKYNFKAKYDKDMSVSKDFKREEALLTGNKSINLSSDIIESTFGIYKSKKSPNKLYGVTSFVLTIPLYSKVAKESVTKTINFKERIVNVKLKGISAWSTEHLPRNWVTERTKTLRKVS